MTLVDLPGIGETPQHDQEYRALYHQLLPELDLIIWILRADERAYAADIAMHQFLLNEGADPSRFLFVLSHADRVFPAEEWNDTEKCPSRQQELSLATVTARVATLFPSSFPVLSVAAPVGWNLQALVSLMIHALPPQATSAVYSHIRGENRSEQARKHAQQTFGDAIGKSFDDCRCPVQLFRPGCYSFCVKPGPALSTCWSHCGITCSERPGVPPWQPYTFTRQRITVTTAVYRLSLSITRSLISEVSHEYQNSFFPCCSLWHHSPPPPATGLSKTAGVRP